MGTLLIKNGTVFDGENFINADIYAKDGVIEKIEKGITSPAGFVYDAAGKSVLPGLVDAHMHIRGMSPDGWAAPADAACFPFGVTAAADASSRLGNSTVAESFGIKCAALPICDVKPEPIFDAVEKKLEDYGEHAAGIKLCYDSTFSPWLKDVKPLAAICDFAHKKGLAVTVHTSFCPVPMSELLSVLQKGDIATHVYHGGGYTVAEDDFKCILDAKKRGVIIDSGIAGSFHADFSIFKNAVDAGALPDIMSTDMTKQLLFTRGGRYGLTMCMSIAKELGMAEKDIFRAVTSSAGKALGRSWGMLKVGGPADIAVLEYGEEPIDIANKDGYRIKTDNGYKCLLTVSDGIIVHRCR